MTPSSTQKVSARPTRTDDQFQILRISQPNDAIFQRSSLEALVKPHQTIRLVRFRHELSRMRSDFRQFDGEPNRDNGY